MAAIFDMDGLLLDTEPLWSVSMFYIAQKHGIKICPDFFKYTTGLRIYEVTEFWYHHFGWQSTATPRQIAEEILDDIIERAMKDGSVLPGVQSTLEWLKQQNILLGVATSSPRRMMERLIRHFNIAEYFKVMVSGDMVSHGKPHPDVYLTCAEQLRVKPWQCIAFEDSLNGMVAAKAARMKVVVIPDRTKLNDKRFGLADAILPTLQSFDSKLWHQLNSEQD